MALLELDITEQRSDRRSNEVGFTVTATNTGDSQLSLKSLVARTSAGGTVIELRDDSLELTKEKHSRLCRELRFLLRSHLIATNEEFRTSLVNEQKKAMQALIDTLPSVLLRSYLTFMSRSFRNSMASRLESSESLLFAISSLSDARLAHDKWISDLDDSHHTKKVYEAKMIQLEQIESSLGESVANSALAELEARDVFTRDYVVRFRRGFFTQKQFTLFVDSYCSSASEGRQEHGSTTKTITVTPYPALLSLVAVFSGLLGAALQYALSPQVGTSPRTFYVKLFDTLCTSTGISAAIIALVFFNIYEHTDLGRRFRMGIDWRSALVIGALSGIAGDRIVAALRAFVGT